MIRALVFLVAASAGAAVVPRAKAAEIPQQVLRCSGVEDDMRRLQCYDQWVLESSPETSPQTNGTARRNEPPESAVPVAEETPAAAAPGAESFGLPETPEPVADAPDQIVAEITNIEVLRSGQRVVTLDNGQVWTEKSANRTLHLDLGDTVTIKSGVFNSFRLFASGNRSSRVDRIE